MARTFITRRWVLATCSLCEAVVAFVNLLMKDPAGSPLLSRLAIENGVVFQGKFALVAAVCLAAGVPWTSPKKNSWLLGLNAVALAGYGLISVFLSRGRLAFFPVALLFMMMAASLGFYLLSISWPPKSGGGEWLVRLAGVVLMGFAMAFLPLGLRWIGFHGSGAYFIWASSFFGFSAVCVLVVSLLPDSQPMRMHGGADAAFPSV